MDADGAVSMQWENNFLIFQLHIKRTTENYVIKCCRRLQVTKILQCASRNQHFSTIFWTYAYIDTFHMTWGKLFAVAVKEKPPGNNIFFSLYKLRNFQHVHINSSLLRFPLSLFPSFFLYCIL